jgi:hypothetical protein
MHELLRAANRTPHRYLEDVQLCVHIYIFSFAASMRPLREIRAALTCEWIANPPQREFHMLGPVLPAETMRYICQQCKLHCKHSRFTFSYPHNTSGCRRPNSTNQIVTR